MKNKIREARLEDAASIVDFQLKMALETENLKLDSPTVVKGVNAVFQDPGKGKYFVAEVENKVVGCLLTVPEWSDWRNGTVLWVHSLYVIESMRGKGIFKDLYLHLKQMIEKSGEFRGIRLYVDKTNLTAQRVYDKVHMSKEHYDLYEWLKP